MSKDDWVKILLLGAGLALLAKVLQEANKNNNQIYRCATCNNILSKGQNPCPNCGRQQSWIGVS